MVEMKACAAHNQSHILEKIGGDMAKRILVLIALLALTVNMAAAQDAKAVLQAVTKAMGADNLKTIQYSGNGGWVGMFGQSYAPGENYPRNDLTSYTRTIDYAARTSREEY